MPRLILLLLALAIAPGGRAAVTSLTVFGDSLSDVGTIAGLLDLFGQPSVTPPPYYDGRFSNGPIYAERLGFPAASALLGGGSNYAAGGALTTSHVGGPLLNALSLQGQIAEFRTRSGGTADPDSAFLLWIGGNDVRFAAQGGDPATGTTLIGDALEVVELALLDLQDMGARRVIVPNLPDFGRTPEFVGDPDLASALSAQWNDGLLELLARSGGPGVEFFDANAFLAGLLDAPAAFGFSNTTEQALLNLDQDPDQFLYWDGIHPTARVHELLAAEIRPLVPEPGIGVFLLIGAVSVLRRQRGRRGC